jgi:cytochrome c
VSKSSKASFLRCMVAASVYIGGAAISPFVCAGDPGAGADVFKQECAECHSVKEGRNKKGPSLFGIVGRNSGSIPDYHYSDALQQDHWVWTADKLHSYLSQPAKKTNPGTKMKYDGLTDAKQLDDLIAYLSTLH